MELFKMLAGLVLLLFGMGYLYRPDRIIKFNAWMREHLFNDHILINHRRKIGVILIALGLMVMFVGIA